MTVETLHKGDQGSQVRQLQKLLVQRGYPADINGAFDTKTWQAARAFQTQNLDQHGQPLVVDGVVGPLTWWSLQNPKPFIRTPTAVDYSVLPARGGSKRGRAALAAAIGELKANAREIGGDNRGAFVRKYLAPAGLDEGNSWCAGFVSFCFMQAAGGDRKAMPFAYTASARTLLAEFKDNGWASAPGSGYTPVPGDIVVWWRVSLAGWLGHVGLVHSVQDGMLYTIEGNHSPRVQGFSYVLSRMDKLLGFGHLP
ncbi:CHAP domain-containing protein [Rhodanobacter sp. Col0626]|uniref:CHAP domain-containing protein n=1 Tax=Rhodanobacter sp. Col0626 TaxID=3415679 RepID=UPI003CE7D07B